VKRCTGQFELAFLVLALDDDHVDGSGEGGRVDGWEVAVILIGS